MKKIRRRARKYCLALVAGAAVFLSMLFSTPQALAARAGTVDVDNTEVREGPAATFKVLDRLPKGSQVAAANQSIDGFYKVRTGAGIIGFISSDALVLQPVPSEDAPPPPPVESAESPGARDTARPTLSTESGFRNKNPKKFIRVKALAGYNFFSVSDVNNQLGASVLQFGPSLGGDISFLFTPDLAFVIRVERMYKNVNALDAVSRKSFTMNLTSYPVMAGVALTLTSAPKWTTHFSVMAGLGLLTDLTATDVSDPPPNVTEMSSTAFTGIASFDLAYNFSKTWSVFAEAGYRYLQTSQLVPSDSENGSSIFQNPTTKNYAPISLNLSGPYVSVGGGITF